MEDAKDFYPFAIDTIWYKEGRFVDDKLSCSSHSTGPTEAGVLLESFDGFKNFEGNTCSGVLIFFGYIASSFVEVANCLIKPTYLQITYPTLPLTLRGRSSWQKRYQPFQPLHGLPGLATR